MKRSWIRCLLVLVPGCLATSGAWARGQADSGKAVTITSKSESSKSKSKRRRVSDEEDSAYLSTFSPLEEIHLAGLSIAPWSASIFPVVILFLMFQRYIIRSVALSGIKGE
jgi:hypothetical protein